MIDLKQVVFAGRIKVGNGPISSLSISDKRVSWLMLRDGFIDTCVNGKRKLFPMSHVQEMEPVEQSRPMTAIEKARAAKAEKRREQPPES